MKTLEILLSVLLALASVNALSQPLQSIGAANGTVRVLGKLQVDSVLYHVPATDTLLYLYGNVFCKGRFGLDTIYNTLNAHQAQLTADSEAIAVLQQSVAPDLQAVTTAGNVITNSILIDNADAAGDSIFIGVENNFSKVGVGLKGTDYYSTISTVGFRGIGLVLNTAAGPSRIFGALGLSATQYHVPSSPGGVQIVFADSAVVAGKAELLHMHTASDITTGTFTANRFAGNVTNGYVLGISGGIPTWGPLAESQVTNLVSDLALKAPVNSPALAGVPTAPTAVNGDNSTRIATTAFVQNAVNGLSGGVTSVDGLTGTVSLVNKYINNLGSGYQAGRIRLQENGYSSPVAVFKDMNLFGIPLQLIGAAGETMTFIPSSGGTGPVTTAQYESVLTTTNNLNIGVLNSIGLKFTTSYALFNGGNVGIGRVPNEKLDVNGNIKAVIPAYDNDGAAGAAGLTTGKFWQTSPTNTLSLPPGVLMVKQ